MRLSVGKDGQNTGLNVFTPNIVLSVNTSGSLSFYCCVGVHSMPRLRDVHACALWIGARVVGERHLYM